MGCKDWDKNVDYYELDKGFALRKVDWEAFSIRFAVYIPNNLFSQNQEALRNMLKDFDYCYEITENGKRIGGVMIEPNWMSNLFLEPPNTYTDDLFNELRKLLLHWSDRAKQIKTRVTRTQCTFLQRQGFRHQDSRRCMIRPTEKFEVSIDKEFIMSRLDRTMNEELIQFSYDAFKLSNENPAEITMESHKESISIFFEYFNDNEILHRASSVIYDTKTNQIAGVCMISLWGEVPLVYDIAVDPSHRGKGLGKVLLQHALSELKDTYPTLRLFVTLGNEAEMLYHKMGFRSGQDIIRMYIPAIDDVSEGS